MERLSNCLNPYPLRFLFAAQPRPFPRCPCAQLSPRFGPEQPQPTQRLGLRSGGALSRTGGRPFATDPRIPQVQAGFDAMLRAVPVLATMHPFGAALQRGVASRRDPGVEARFLDIAYRNLARYSRAEDRGLNTYAGAGERAEVEAAGVTPARGDMLTGDFRDLPEDFTYVLHLAHTRRARLVMTSPSIYV